MNAFTAAGDPSVEQVVNSHMKRVVEVIRSGMEPDAILLRGSFGKGEGDVLCEDDHLKFLSDYEINAATYSFRHRAFLASAAQRLSTELGVETSIVWMRPDYFQKLRVGPFVAGPVPITISLYETRYGSRILYGEDILRSAPEIDPACIAMQSGLQLVLNRMAEALQYLPEPETDAPEEWESLYWVNKLILACVESLLLSWGQYHFSYRERGRRFSALAKGRLAFLGDEAQSLYQLAQRATAFKMEPSRDLYPASLRTTLRQVMIICQRVFEYLAFREWGVTINDPYMPYPEQYLQAQCDRMASFSYQRALYKVLDVYKYLRTWQPPLNLASPNTAGEVVYSIVPLLFAGWGESGTALRSMMKVVRHQMMKVGSLPPPARDARSEWRQLCSQMLVLWKNFCT